MLEVKLHPEILSRKPYLAASATQPKPERSWHLRGRGVMLCLMVCLYQETKGLTLTVIEASIESIEPGTAGAGLEDPWTTLRTCMTLNPKPRSMFLPITAGGSSFDGVLLVHVLEGGFKV